MLSFYSSLSSASSSVMCLLIMLFLTPFLHCCSATHFCSCPWLSTPITFLECCHFLTSLNVQNHLSRISSITSIMLSYTFMISPIFRFIIFSFLRFLVVLCQKYISVANNFIACCLLYVNVSVSYNITQY